MKKKILSLLMVMAIIAGVVFQPVCGSMTAQAKTPFMKKLGVKWDLKEGKWVKIRVHHKGNVWQEVKVTIKNVKIQDAKKEGYKKLSYTVVGKREKYTPSQVHKVAKSANGAASDILFLDNRCYDIDGFQMSSAYDSDIKEKENWKHSKVYKCEDSDGCSVDFFDNFKGKCTIIYPEKDYKKICIGICGNGSYKYHGDDSNLWECPVYKKDKKSIHFMLVG